MNHYENYDLDPENDINTTPEDLDVEWLRQSGLFLKYSKAAADCELAVKRAHENLKVIRSELILEANNAGAKNDAAREAYYRTHPRHQEAKEELFQAEYERDIINGGKSSIYMKKSALENFVKLAAMGWTSVPVAPKSFEQLSAKMEEYESRSVNEKIRAATRTRSKK